jgi:hypothetical protein
MKPTLRVARTVRILAAAWLAWTMVQIGPVSGQLAVPMDRGPAAEPWRGSFPPIGGSGQGPFHRSDPDDPHRYVGWGKPLQGTSWRNRPLHVGWGVGGLLGAPLIDGHVDQGEQVMGAYRIGWDFGHYWATELRFAFAYLDVIDGQEPPVPRDCRHLYWDGHLLYYPWGDAKWRPFASLGAGIASFQFGDDQGRHFNEVLFEVPFGLGVKYQARKWLALRLDVKDNLAIAAAGLSTMHNVSIMGGVEVHCGGRPTSYYPWNPGVHLR